MRYSYRLAQTDHYTIGDLTCNAVYLFEHGANKDDIEIVISPQLGMGLLGFSLRHIPILQKSRIDDFVKGRKGLGPLILPHFNQRASFPVLDAEKKDAFAHVNYLKQKGILDPFQHGAGRYVPWEYETRCDETMAQVKGTINADTEVQGIPLREIVGFNFTAYATYTLSQRNLTIQIDVSGSEPVAAGIHYYYGISGDSRVEMTVDSIGITDDDNLFEFSEHQRTGKFYNLSLQQDLDTVFTPRAEEKGMARYKLITPEYRLDTRVLVEGPPENTFDSVVIFSPEGEDFVCVEPLSAKDGLKPVKKEFHGKVILHPIIQK